MKRDISKAGTWKAIFIVLQNTIQHNPARQSTSVHEKPRLRTTQRVAAHQGRS